MCSSLLINSGITQESEDEKLEETEDQFLERYAQKAQELEKEALEEAEGGEEEDGCELDIGKLFFAFDKHKKGGTTKA